MGEPPHLTDEQLTDAVYRVEQLVHRRGWGIHPSVWLLTHGKGKLTGKKLPSTPLNHSYDFAGDLLAFARTHRAATLTDPLPPGGRVGYVVVHEVTLETGTGPIRARTAHGVILDGRLCDIYRPRHGEPGPVDWDHDLEGHLTQALTVLGDSIRTERGTPQ